MFKMFGTMWSVLTVCIEGLLPWANAFASVGRSAELASGSLEEHAKSFNVVTIDQLRAKNAKEKAKSQKTISKLEAQS